MHELPTGTVTFLFTDIEGSTRLLEELGQRYAELLAEHRRLLRETFERHEGVEFGTEGDASFAVFRRAGDAVAAAGDAQRALARGSVRVRMGVHTGEPTLTGVGYVGLDVHRVARIAAAGHGGQVLVSETTCALPDGQADLRDLGEHRLKDLADPIRLFQLGRDEFPPLRSLSRARLPLEIAPLVGRKRELGDLLRLLGRDRARLVTLTGPGGIGKTTLAVAAAAELIEAFDDGVVLVELAAIREPALVLPAVAEALGGEGDALTQVESRELLLVLDNLEQVIEASSEIGRLLTFARKLSVLATSREPLRIAGEREFPLRPLAEAPAVELFRQRAEAVVPEFSAEYARLAEICRRLDSLPLAIELAAARVKVLPPGELLGRLERRLPLLTASRRDVPERQRTLRATIEWSYDLLTTDERKLFARLGVFSGGWTLDAAEVVCGADLDTLASLLDKSLIRRDLDRFSLLETIREYALERLQESGEADAIRRGHATYFVDVAEAAEREHQGPAQAPLRERFRADWENVRTALGWAVEAGDKELGLRLVGALTMIWLDRNLAVEADRWLNALFALDGSVHDLVRAKALMTASTVAGVRSDFERSERCGEEALGYFRAAGSEAGVAWTLTNLALMPMEAGRPAEAAPLLAEAEALHRKLGSDAGLRRVLHLQGQQAADVGDVERGRRLLREAVERSAAAEDTFSLATSLHSLGDVELAAGDVAAAEERYQEALRVSWETGADRLVCYALAGLAATAATRGDDARAAPLWGFTEAYEARLRFTLRWRGLYAERLDPLASAYRDAYERGARLDVEAAVEIASGSAQS